jgi:hypothetical protein
MMDFPLIVTEDRYIKICPECLCGQDSEKDKCEICGCDLTEVEGIFDECENQYLLGEMEKVAKRLNTEQPFYTVSVDSGNYCGLQFYVEDKYWKIEQMDNEESQEEFGMCRSKMLRKYKTAGNLIRRELRKAKYDLGLWELGIVAQFSNGETIYTKVA